MALLMKNKVVVLPSLREALVSRCLVLRFAFDQGTVGLGKQTVMGYYDQVVRLIGRAVM